MGAVEVEARPPARLGLAGPLGTLGDKASAVVVRRGRVAVGRVRAALVVVVGLVGLPAGHKQAPVRPVGGRNGRDQGRPSTYGPRTSPLAAHRTVAFSRFQSLDPSAVWKFIR